MLPSYSFDQLLTLQSDRKIWKALGPLHLSTHILHQILFPLHHVVLPIRPLPHLSTDISPNSMQCSGRHLA